MHIARRFQHLKTRWLEGIDALPIRLSEVPQNQAVLQARSHYEKVHAGKVGRGFYRDADWHRFHFVAELLENSGNVLDIGVFTGQFVDALLLSGQYDKVVGIDVAIKPNFTMKSAGADIRVMNVANLDFPDNAFDIVTCMEVLEHLEVQDFQPALDGIRRVCNRQLVVSLPFNEQVPLSPNHRQRFTAADIRRLFPNGNYSLLYSHKKCPVWILIEERNQPNCDAHAMTTANVT